MKKTFYAGAVAATLLTPVTALAEITWVPQVGVQMKTLEFEQKLKADSPRDSGEGSLKVDMPTLSLSLTGIYEKFYLSLKYEDSFDDASSFSDVPNTDAETNMQRIDYSVTMGYNVFDGANVFVGYMNGETTLDPEPLCPAYAQPGVSFPAFPDCGDGGLGFPSKDGNKAQDNRVLGLANYEQTYEEDGWFVGASYAWSFSDVGSLSVSVAYAELDASYQDNWLVGSTDFASEIHSYDFEGDASGLSIGINWSAPLTERVGYYIDLRQQSYDMSALQVFDPPPERPVGSTEPEPQARETRRVKTDETIVAITAGIQWYF